MKQLGVITLLPEMFTALTHGVIGRAIEQGIAQVHYWNPRDWARNDHRQVDDRPYGGGPGMVMRADVAAAAIDAVDRAGRPLIYLSPRGRHLDQARVRELAAGPGAILLCGRFEGLDQRVIDARQIEEISIGDFVLAGGEIAAMALVEAAVRLIPGVLGDHASTDEESFSSGLLEYPQYTRPQEFEGRSIPEVLSGGNHSEIAKYRLAQAQGLTRERRPDLWTLYEKAKS